MRELRVLLLAQVHPKILRQLRLDVSNELMVLLAPLVVSEALVADEALRLAEAAAVLRVLVNGHPEQLLAAPGESRWLFQQCRHLALGADPCHDADIQLRITAANHSYLSDSSLRQVIAHMMPNSKVPCAGLFDGTLTVTHIIDQG